MGEMLREARERLGLSVAEVAGQTKLAPRQIEALEAEDFRRLPEMAFVRGFVRGYAKILHLDAERLLAALPQTEAASKRLEPVSVEAPFPGAHSPQRQNLIWLGAALLLAVIVVAFAVWHFTSPPTKREAARVETPVPLPDKAPGIPAQPVTGEEGGGPPAATLSVVEAKQLPPPAAKPQVSQSAAKAAALHLIFGEESWAEITDKGGKVLASQTNPRGSELRLEGSAPFSLVIGRAASVRLYHRGKQIDLAPYTNASSEVARLTLE